VANRYQLACFLLAVVAVQVLAYVELQRVADGRLFLFTLPWDAPPSRVELIDAKSTARRYQLPALVTLAAVACVVVYFGRFARSRVERRQIGTWLLALFVLATLADLATTLWFFHARGIDHEVHPAIRLFGYAYGRTVGPVLGKVLQSLGLWLVALHLPRYGAALVLAAVVLYGWAAIHNALLR
jgi:hypothetical protein